MSDEDQALDVRVVQAQTRLQNRYNELKQNGGGWRSVADEVGLNMRYVWEFAAKGILPGNEELLEILLHWQPPAKEKRPMQPKMVQLLNLIQSHVGEDRRVKRRDLLEDLFGLEAAQDESNNNPWDREMREMIQELNRDYGALIVGSPKGGYFWGSSLAEVLKSVETQMKGARTQLVNAAHLKANAKRCFGGQLGMDL